MVDSHSHSHDVTLTAADFTALRDGEIVRKYTCLDDPNFIDHEFALSCAGMVMPETSGDIGTSTNCPG